MSKGNDTAEVLATVGEILAGLEALGSSATNGHASSDYASDSLYFHFTSALMQTWQCPFDGWIAGFAHSYSTGLGIAINLVPPAAAVSVHQVYTGFVLPPQNEAWQTASLSLQGANPRWRFKQGDIINVRPLVAGTGFVLLIVCHSI